MRRILHICGIAFIWVFSIQTFIAVLDWLARWDWLKSLMDAHPLIATYIRTPISYIVVGGIAFGSLWLERRLKESHIAARWTNWWFYPDLKTTTLKFAIDEQNKAPGWDMHPLNWHLFIEVQLANDSDTPATLEDAEAVLRIGRFGPKIEAVHIRNVETCRIDRGRNRKGEYIAPQMDARPVEVLRGLMAATKNVPLTKGIGYSGWLRFYVKNLSMKDKARLQFDVFLIDALQGKHKLQYKKKSDRQWDNNFYIFPDYQ